MDVLHVHGLASFVRLLTGHPPAADVAPALAAGPLARLGAVGVLVCVRSGDDLVTVSWHGFTDDEATLLSRISLDADTPVTRAVHAGVPLAWASLAGDFPLLQLDAHVWAAAADRLGAGPVMAAPVTADGAGTGALLCLFAEDRAPAAETAVVLDVLGGVLGLWSSHPRLDVTHPGTHRHVAGLGLTARQVQVLLRIERGDSNEAIARSLGYSSSTIKQEVNRLLRRLRCPDRHAAARRARSLGLLGAVLPAPAHDTVACAAPAVSPGSPEAEPGVGRQT